jgi:hypothetical protein
MMLFILGQIVGLLVFIIFNLALFLFIKYKRSQTVSRIYNDNEKKWTIRFSYLFIGLFCFFGMSFRALSYQDEAERSSHQRVRKDQIIDRRNRSK